MSAAPKMPDNVVQAFDRFDDAQHTTLMAVREMIFAVAGENAEVGQVEEALRWGEPAYLTSQSKSGSTIRLGIERASGQPALFFNCKTTLVEEFRAQFGTALRFSKNRAIVLDGPVEAHAKELQICIAAALTYHRRGAVKARQSASVQRR